MSDDLRHTPGWFPDPTRRFQLRWFNGQRWTADVAVDGRRMIDQPSPRGQASGRSVAIAAFCLALGALVVGWLPFLVVLAVPALALAVIFGIKGVRRRQTSADDGRGFSIAALSIAVPATLSCVVGVILTVVVWRGLDDYVGPGPHLVTPGACTVSGGVATFAGTLRNTGPHRDGYRVVVRISSAGTERTAAVVLDDVAAGATVPWTAHVPVDGPAATCVVEEVTGSARYLE